MNNCVVIWNGDWADEFYIFGYEIVPKDWLNKVIEVIENMSEEERSESDEYYFGTNEYMDFTYNDILEVLKEAIPINDSEYETITKILGYNQGQTFLDNIVYKLVEEGYLDSKYERYN